MKPEDSKDNQESLIDLEDMEGASYDDYQLSEDERKRFIEQVDKEYRLCEKSFQSRLVKVLNYLKLYNNQKRKADKLGDPLGFTIFQTLLAALYMDEINVVFEGDTENDDPLMDNVMAIAKSDARDTKKNQLDFFQLWDMLMYSVGIVEISEFVKSYNGRTYNMPLPRLVDPASFLIDPGCSFGINGIGLKNEGAARFLGQLLDKTKYELDQDEGFYNIDRVATPTGSLDSPLKKAKEMRLNARGSDSSAVQEQRNIGTNQGHEILLWDTHFELDSGDVRKVRGYLANERTLDIKFQVREDKDNRWPYVTKTFNPQSGSFWGTSLFDLVEDKQRLKAVLTNLGLESVLAILYPKVGYNTNMVKDARQLNYKGRRFVPVDGDPRTAFAPMRTVDIDANFLSFMKDNIDVDAQKATAAPEMQQGVLNSSDRTLGELQMVRSGVDSRRGLAREHILLGDAEFWYRWYQMYDLYMGDDIDQKRVKVTGTNNPRYLTLARKDIIGERYPIITVESKEIVTAQRRAELIDRLQIANFLLQDPASDRRYYIKMLLELTGMTSEQRDAVMPLTADELRAEKENEVLSTNEFDDGKGFMVQVQPTDNDTVHLRVHARAKDNNAKKAHIRAHVESVRLKQTNPELFVQDQEGVQGLQPGEFGGEPVVQGQSATPNNNIMPSL